MEMMKGYMRIRLRDSSELTWGPLSHKWFNKCIDRLNADESLTIKSEKTDVVDIIPLSSILKITWIPEEVWHERQSLN